jgi:hypothetical protein
MFTNASTITLTLTFPLVWQLNPADKDCDVYIWHADKPKGTIEVSYSASVTDECEHLLRISGCRKMNLFHLWLISKCGLLPWSDAEFADERYCIWTTVQTEVQRFLGALRYLLLEPLRRTCNSDRYTTLTDTPLRRASTNSVDLSDFLCT